MKKSHSDHQKRIILRRPEGITLRRGLPKEARKAIYVHFIELSWPRFFLSAGMLSLSINALFALLYLLDPGGISGARAGNFFDAFMFSVETFATIGYGHLAPTGKLTNILVILEAAAGMMWVALFTGLLFSKIARPRTQFLFSKSLLITYQNQKPYLAFRVANIRGGEILDAHITVSALVNENTPEQDNLRRMHELKLVRDHSPFFALSWTVLHELNESSPLHGILDESFNCENLIAISAVIRGHDGTYGQTVYHRHNYYLDDIHVNHRFVDVISDNQHGNVVLDFTRFHESEELPV